ncbi:MAG: hypothetical protein HOM16_06765 [Woeseia sp.]|nr:hypothetical protein [Woeseia sp.]
MISLIENKHFIRGIRTATALLLIAPTLIFADSETSSGSEDEKAQIPDPYIRAFRDVVYDQRPPRPVPGRDYGMITEDGKFTHPKATPMVTDPPTFEGQLDYWDQNSYAKNVEVVNFVPEIVSPFHLWQNIVDFGDRRIMYSYGGRDLGVFDITDPKDVKTLWRGGTVYSGDGFGPEENPLPPGDRYGAASIQWNNELGKYVMVQSLEVARIGVMHDKLTEPEGVEKIRKWGALKGFKVYALNGPLPSEWELLAAVTTDYEHPNAPIGKQQGSGSLDVPAWFGGKYMFLAAAPNDSYALIEYPDYLHSPGYQAWDMSDPRNPRLLDQFAAPGQIVGDKDHEDAYLMNPRAGNRTSWMGSRMPPFLSQPVEEGGRYAFGGMAGLGLHVLDVSDPENMQSVGHLALPPKFGGTEADNIDVSQYERTGYVFMNGYPMNDECFEPYKDIFVIDAKDVTNPHVVTTFPRPTPPENAAFTDYCQRRGSFGPKRPGYHTTQPGRWMQNIVPYAFYNAGVQLFDVSDPTNPTIAGYYVPRFPNEGEIFGSAYGNLTFGIYVEYDRNIIWAFTNHGFYALTSPLLGNPINGVPKESWPTR